MKTPNSARIAAGFRWLATAVVVLVVATGGIVQGTAAQAESLSEVTIAKTASATTASIGSEVIYSLDLTCFSTTDGCLGVSVTDQLPAGLEFTGFVPSAPAASFATWNLDAATRVLTINFTDTISSGSTPSLSYSARVASDGSVQDGDKLTNTATVSATNATASDTDETTVTAKYEAFGRVTSTTTWDDEDATASGVEFSDKESVITVSGLNAGSRNAASLTIDLPGDGDDIFSAFDVTSLGGALPAGGTSATVELKLADGTTISVDANTTSSSWSITSLPSGLSFDDIVGVSVRFEGDIAGTAVLGSPATSAGTLVMGVVQRDDRRGTNDNLILNGTDRTIEAKPTVTVGYADIADGSCNDCVQKPHDTYTVVYPQPSVKVTKSNYAVVGGGALVEGANQQVTNTITATNTSPGGIGELKIVDAQPGLDNPFALNQIDLVSLGINFPTGADSAVVTINLPSGNQQFTLTSNASNWSPSLTGGASLADATGFSISFVDTDGNYLANGTSAVVDVVSTVNDSVTVAASGAGNSAQATVTSAELPLSSGVAVASTGLTAPLVVTKPVYSIGLTKRVTNGFLNLGTGATTQFRQTATVGAATATDRVVLQDPSDAMLTDSSNPFRLLTILKIVDTTVPTDAQLAITYFDGRDNTWKAVPSLSGLTGVVTASLPADVRENALGLRYEYTPIANTMFAPGRVFAANFQSGMRDTVYGTSDELVKGSFRNCSSAWIGDNPDGGEAGPEKAIKTLEGLECPIFTFGPKPTGGGAIDKVTLFKEVKEQSVKIGTPSDVTDSLINNSVTLQVFSDGAKTATIEDSTQTAPQWWPAFDLKTLGGSIYAGTTDAATASPITLTKYQQAKVSWLSVSGAELGTTTVTGSGTVQSSGTPFTVDVRSAANAAGVDYEKIAGYSVKFSEATGATIDPSEDPAPGALEDEFFGQFSSIRGIQLGMVFQIRELNRADNTAVLDENCFGVDGNLNGTVECDPSVVDYLPLNSGDGDEGWVNNFATGSIKYTADSEGTDFTGTTDGSKSAARIVPAIVDVKTTTSFVHVVDPSDPASATAGELAVPPVGTPAADYPAARVTSGVTLVQEVPVNKLVLSVPQLAPANDCVGTTGPECHTPVPAIATSSTAPLSPFDTFDLVGITITGTGATVGKVSALIAYADGTTSTLGPLSAADLSAAITALSRVSDIVGLQLTAIPASGSTGIDVGSSLSAVLDLRLRESVRSTGADIRTLIAGGTATVVSATLGSALDIVANDHAAVTASLVLRAAGVGVTATKSFTPATGQRDLLPTTSVTIKAGNSGELGVQNLVIRDIDDSAGISDTWDSFDLVSIDSLVAPRSGSNAAADTACLRIFTWATPGNPVPSNCITIAVDADGTFPVDLGSIDPATVRGIDVAFYNEDGSVVNPSPRAADSASLVFTVKLRAATLSTGQVIPLVPITNTATAGVVLNGVTTVHSVSADYTPTSGNKAVDVEKLSRSASTGEYDRTSAVAQSGDTVNYALVVRNTGTTIITNPSVVDLPPAQLSLVPSTLSGFDIDNANNGSDNWSELDPSLAPTVSVDPVTRALTWTYPAGVELKPGHSLRIRVSFQIAAGASGQLVNKVATPVASASECPIDTYDSALGLCESNHVIVASIRGGVSVEKFSSGSLGATNQAGGSNDCLVSKEPGFTTFPCAALAAAGDSFDYRAKLTNNGVSAFTSVTLTDKLPQINDTALTVGGAVGARNGEWTSTIASTLSQIAFERVDADGTVSTIDPADVAAFYTTGTPCASDVDAKASTSCDAADWTTWSSQAAPAATTGIQFVFDLTARPLGSGDAVRATWKVTTPDAPLSLDADTTDFRGGDADGRLTQWNTVAGAGITAAGTIFAGESSKAGAAIDAAELVIRKTLIDQRTKSGGDEVFSFAFECVNDSATVVASGTFTITAAELADGAVDVGYFVPTGAECTVTETDAAGAEVTPRVQSVTIGETGSTVVASITNRFGEVDAEVETGEIAVTKHVNGDASANSVYEVTLTRTGADTHEKIVVRLKADQTKVIKKLPLDAEYKVTETRTGGADSIKYEGLTSGVAVPEHDAPLEVTVVNTFEKDSTTEGGGKLAFTGTAGTLLMLLMAALLIAAGTATVLAVRIRPRFRRVRS